MSGPSPEEFRNTASAWISEHRDRAPALGGELTAERVEQWRAWSALIHRSGYAGITWPEEFGGRGLSARHQAVWLEEIAAARVPDHLGVIGLGMAGPTIIAWGSEEQKMRLLPAILDCSEIWCQGFSEPASGSDLAGVQASAVQRGEDWVVNGQKVWSSFAHIADWCLLLVRSDRAAAKHEGLTMLLARLDADGVEVRPLRQLTGDPEFNEIFFTDAAVPRVSGLGGPGDGWRVAMTTLSHERGTYGIGLAASLEAEFGSAVEDLRRSGGEHGGLRAPGVREELTDIWVELRALVRTNAQTLADIEESGLPGPQATISKLRWSLLNQRLTALVSDQLRNDADVPVEVSERWDYARLRSRGNTIEAGTSEILRNIVSERVLGLPRSR